MTSERGKPGSPPTLLKRIGRLWRHFVLRIPPRSRDGDWSEYYDHAEASAAVQWSIIEPYLREAPQPDLSVVLDFACGRGRIAERFVPVSGKLICVDTSTDAINRCRQRFAKATNVECLVGGGGTIPAISGSITFLYSWDAMVHFNIPELEESFVEFQRVLRPRGMALIHHSNYAAWSGVARPWTENPGSRAYVSAQDVRGLCEKRGLTVIRQQVMDWSAPNLDCITILRKR